MKKLLLKIVLALLVVALIAAGWFYFEYVRLRHYDITEGVHAVLAGGSNSVIVRDGGQTLLIDTKFAPGSRWLRKWMSKNGGPPTIVVDTHYHYDHTEGNPEYPDARIVAHRLVPELMASGGEFGDKRPKGIPTELVDDSATLTVGKQQVSLFHPPPAHTHGDLWAVFRRGDKEIVATGDLVFHTYYPFFDLAKGGANVQGIIHAVRDIAASHPNAVFVPGHGPLATADDLKRYADYLEELDRSVAKARKDGLSEDQAVARIDLSKWKLSRLPSFHDRKLCWATAKNNIRSVYRLQSGSGDAAHPPCSFLR